MENQERDNMIRAICYGNIAQVKELVANSETHFERTSDAYDLLCTALLTRFRKITKFLLKSGFPVNCKSKRYSDTPLHLAVMDKDIEIVMMLLKRGAKVNAKNRLGETPLHLAAKNGNWTNAKLLLNKNAHVNIANKDNESPIYYAIASDDAKMTELFLRYSCCIDVKSPEGESPLYIAVNFQRVEIVKQLLNRGAYLSMRSVPNGYTPLHRAVILNNETIVKLLLDKEADINATSENATPLHLAVELQHERMVKLLLERKGIDVDGNVTPANVTIETPLCCAATRQSAAIVRMLLEAGACIGAKNRVGETALDAAIAIKNEAIVAILLKFGAAACYERYEDSSPLHIAAIHDFFTITRDLLEEFVDVELRNKNGQTALHLASKYANSDIVRELLDYGADVNATCDNGHLPIDYLTPALNEQNNRSWHQRTQLDYDITACFILHHIQKLNSLNRHVNNENYKLFNVVHGFEYYQTICEDYVELIKSVKIGNTNISFYDLLAKSIDQLAILSRNKSIVDALKSFDSEVKFSTYHKMIHYHWKKGQNRGKLLSSSLKAFYILSRCTLPESLLLDIFCYLSNEDLKNLTEADNESDRT